MLFYFIVFYLPFFWWNICGFNRPVVADTDHYMNSHSVWTPAGLSFVFLSCYQDWLLPLRTSKRLCWYVMWWLLYGWKWRRGSICLLWPRVCISIHLHLTFTPGKCMPRDWAFLSVQVLRSHVCSCWHQAMSKINTEPLVFSILSSHPFLKFFAIEMDTGSD